MFWIGFIVGIITLIVASFAFLAWCFWVTETTFEEFKSVVNVNAAAWANRESVMQVWHDGELLDEVILEEK